MAQRGARGAARRPFSAGGQLPSSLAPLEANSSADDAEPRVVPWGLMMTYTDWMEKQKIAHDANALDRRSLPGAPHVDWPILHSSCQLLPRTERLAHSATEVRMMIRMHARARRARAPYKRTSRVYVRAARELSFRSSPIVFLIGTPAAPRSQAERRSRGERTCRADERVARMAAARPRD